MNHTIDISYFGNGNRNFPCLHQYNAPLVPTCSVKSGASNYLERNYLNFPSSFNSKNSNNNFDDDRHKKTNSMHDVDPYKPEYKIMKSLKDQNIELNNYLNPLGQYTYKDNPMIKSAEQIFETQKNKKFIEIGHNAELQNMEKTNREYDNRILLKNPLSSSILQSNKPRLETSTKYTRRVYPPSVNPNMDEVKKWSYLESRTSPEYLRNYDKECLENIDNYYIKNNQNLQLLSRFGNWVTVKPDTKDRSNCLEKMPHGVYETSCVVPEWMDIKARNKEHKFENCLKDSKFKAMQWNNTMKDNTRVTMLIDRNQKDAKPLFLRDSYEKNRILLENQKNNINI